MRYAVSAKRNWTGKRKKKKNTQAYVWMDSCGAEVKVRGFGPIGWLALVANQKLPKTAFAYLCLRCLA
jgi:hypothetical protein